MYEEEYIDPFLSDEEIKQTFSPNQQRFYAWVEDGSYHRANSGEGPISKFSKALHETFPDIENVDDEFFRFSQKWFGKSVRRSQYPIPPARYLSTIRSTSCKDPEQLAKILFMFMISRVSDVPLGESHFGGVLTGYVLNAGCHSLFPDIPYDEMRDPNNPDLLDYAILAVNIDESASRLAVSQSDGKERRRQNRNSGEDSAVSGVCSQSANSNGSLKGDSFCFLQIGALIACTGAEWANVRDKDDKEIADADWEDTGYNVVVKLDGAGYPTGPVFVLYSFHQEREAWDGPISEPIEWCDSQNEELPHIRRLYPACNQKFFLAQITNKLEDLKKGTTFDFRTVATQRCIVTRAKMTGADGRIVSNDVPYNTCDIVQTQVCVGESLGASWEFPPLPKA